MTEPLSLLDVETKIAEIADRLSELVAEHEHASQLLAAAEAGYERAFHSKRAELYLNDAKMKVDAVESIARVAAIDAFDRLQIAKHREAFIRHAMRSHQSVLSAYQTTGKFVADEAGHNRYGRSR